MTMYPGKAPNYRLKQAYNELPQHAFIRPVREYFLPQHIKDEMNPFFDENKDVYCLTSKGFIVIPWDLIEES